MGIKVSHATIEVYGCTKTPALGELEIVCGLEAFDIDLQIFENLLPDLAESPRAVDGLTASVGKYFFAVVEEFVSLGVAAKVIVVVEDENRRVGIFFLIKVRGR